MRIAGHEPLRAHALVSLHEGLDTAVRQLEHLVNVGRRTDWKEVRLLGFFGGLAGFGFRITCFAIGVIASTAP